MSFDNNKNTQSLAALICLACMLVSAVVNAQQSSNINHFHEVVKEVEELKKTDLTLSLKKLLIFESQLTALSVEQNLNFFKLAAEIYIDQGQYTKAKNYTNQGLKIAKRLASPSILISELLYIKGFALESLGDLSQASDDYKKGLEVAESLHNKVQIATGLMNLGAIAYLTDDYERSLVLLNDAYNIAMQTNDEELKGLVNNELGTIYSYLLQDEQSMVYYQQAYLHFKKAGMLNAAHSSLINIAVNHIYEKDFPQAIDVFKTLINESTKDSPSDSMYNVYSGMAWAQLDKKDSNPEAAYQYLLMAKQYIQSTDRYDVQLQFYVDEASVLFKLDRFKDALTSLYLAEEILSTHQELSMLKKHVYARIINLKADVFYQQKKFQQAYQAKTELIALTDVLYEKEESRSINEVRLKLEAEQADVQNKVLHNQQTLHETSLKQAQLANEEQRLYLIISGLIALAFAWLLIKLIHSQHSLRIASNIDPLTGIDNRRSLMKKAQVAFKQSKAKGSEFSLLMIDVDHFKSINDQLGHSTGDKVLKKVATLGASMMRKSDVFGRFGGEEFMVCLPNTTFSSAMDIGERIRLSISQHPWQLNDFDHASVSVGVACLATESDLISLIKLADEKLYQAKASGRNKVCG